MPGVLRWPARTRRVFRAAASTIVPEAASLDAVQWDELEAIVDRSLAARPARLRRQLTLFLDFLDWLPVVRYGRRLGGLDAARRTQFLTLLENAPLRLVRHGFWGLRTVVLMGYYGRPDAAAAIGYRADPRGWEARR